MAIVTGAYFQVNNDNVTDNAQLSPSFAALNHNTFIAVWVDTSDAVAGPQIKGQVFNAEGQKIGGELTFNVDPVSADARPYVIALSDGNIAVSWLDGTNVELRKFNADLSPATDEIDLGPFAADYQVMRGARRLSSLTGNL